MSVLIAICVEPKWTLHTESVQIHNQYIYPILFILVLHQRPNLTQILPRKKNIRSNRKKTQNQTYFFVCGLVVIFTGPETRVWQAIRHVGGFFPSFFCSAGVFGEQFSDPSVMSTMQRPQFPYPPQFITLPVMVYRSTFSRCRPNRRFSFLFSSMVLLPSINASTPVEVWKPACTAWTVTVASRGCCLRCRHEEVEDSGLNPSYDRKTLVLQKKSIGRLGTNVVLAIAYI